MSSESSDEEKNYVAQSDLTFVAKFIKDNPVILNKAKNPAVVRKKEQALDILKNNIQSK